MRKFGLLLTVGFLWGQEKDSLPTYTVDTVRIEEVSANRLSPFENSVDKVLRLAPNTQSVYRSVPFAQEVVYQGLLPTQTQVTIDGMRILPACVDRMDPVLTFIEAAALENVAWQAAERWGATPTMVVHLFSPEGPQEGRAALLAGDNYHRLSFNARHRKRIGRFSYASAITFRKGGDYRIGRNFLSGSTQEDSLWRRGRTLKLPSFDKLNFYTALQYAISEKHYVEASYLGDHFYNVAYPALIMDAIHSAMHLVSFRYVWRGVSDLRVYGSTIFHDMTDTTRPEEEIRTRIVMPNMYMPMKGITRTAGAIWEITWWEKGKLTIRQRNEYSYNMAYGSMEMLPLGGGAVMRLLNLADVRFHQGGTSLMVGYHWGSWRVEADGRWNLFSYRIEDTLNFLPLKSYQEGYAGASESERRFSVYEVGLRTAWSLRSHEVRGHVSIGTRAPTHTELYAFYLYVPMDNSIQMGNSVLRPERLLRAEIEYEYSWHRLRVRVSAFGNRMEDYISPVTFLLPMTGSNRTRQQWRILKNTGTAYTAGFTAQGSLHLAENSLLEAWTGYTYGWHETLREPLPWIYPFFGRLRYTYQYRRHRVGVELYGAADQHRLSRTIYIEDYTSAYWLMHLRYGFQLWERESFGVLFTASVENLLDAYGWDHLSVGNMPFLGRVIRGGVVATW